MTLHPRHEKNLYNVCTGSLYLHNKDTSVMQTLGSVPLVSILRRFDLMVLILTPFVVSRDFLWERLNGLLLGEEGLLVASLLASEISTTSTSNSESSEESSSTCNINNFVANKNYVLGPVQMPLHSCANPNCWIKYGKRAASELVWYGSFS